MTSAQRIIKYCALAFAVFLSVSIIGGIISMFVCLTGIFGGGDAAGEMKSYTVNENIENLDIDISAATLEIKNGKDLSVESNHNYLKVKEKDGTLVISDEKPFWVFNVSGVKVILTVPYDKVFDKASVSAGAGRVSIESLSANTLDLDFGAGEVDIENLVGASKAEINGGTGKLTVRDGALCDLDLDMGVGALYLTSRLSGKCELDYGVGETHLVLLGTSEEYQIDFDKGLGSATLEGKEMSDGSVYGTGDSKIYIDGGVGSVSISFRDYE